jgi:hypothetical protein
MPPLHPTAGTATSAAGTATSAAGNSPHPPCVRPMSGPCILLLNGGIVAARHSRQQFRPFRLAYYKPEYVHSGPCISSIFAGLSKWQSEHKTTDNQVQPARQSKDCAPFLVRVQMEGGGGLPAIGRMVFTIAAAGRAGAVLGQTADGRRSESARAAQAAPSQDALPHLAQRVVFFG